jgi:hypothetical protein
MALNVTRADVWAASIEDLPGGLAEKLAALAEAGAQLAFVIAQRASERIGTGRVLLTPLKGSAQIGAARKAGFEKTKNLHLVRVEGPDQPGLGAKMTQSLAQARINLRGVSAAAIGPRCVVHLALDSTADATKASRLLKRL